MSEATFLGQFRARLVATLSQYLLCLRRFRVSSVFPLYIATRAASPACSTWDKVEFGLSKITAACWSDTFSMNFFQMDPLPIPNKREVVSHPMKACKKSICLHVKEPNPDFTSLMFHTRLFEFVLGSEWKKISLLPREAWNMRSTSRSASSPTKAVSIDKADSTAFLTMSRSAERERERERQRERVASDDELILVTDLCI